MSTEVTVIGDRRMAATIRRAAKSIGDMTGPGSRAAVIIATAGRGRAPRRTGALAASVTPTPKATATAASVSSRIPYAAVIHYGWPARRISAHPFLTDAASATAGAWQPLYQARIAEAVDSVKGA